MPCKTKKAEPAVPCDDMSLKKKKSEEDEEEGAAKPMPMPGIPADAVRKASMVPLTVDMLKKAQQMGLFGDKGSTKEKEGSRGGTVTGHTASGKAIYEKKEPSPRAVAMRAKGKKIADAKAWENHSKAAKFHSGEADAQHRQSDDAEKKYPHLSQKHATNIAMAHRRLGNAHGQAANDHELAAENPGPSMTAGAQSATKDVRKEEARTQGSIHHNHKEHHYDKRDAAKTDREKQRHQVAADQHGKALTLWAEHERGEDVKTNAVAASKTAHDQTAASGGGPRGVTVVKKTNEGEQFVAESKKSLGDVFRSLLKAAEAGKPSSTDPSKAAAKPPAKPVEAEPGDAKEEETEEEGTHEHHKDRALAHLQAAQAHATAAHSAKKVEAAQEHGNVVGAAQQASEAAMAMAPEKPGKGKDQPVKKAMIHGDRITEWADQFPYGTSMRVDALELIKKKVALDRDRGSITKEAYKPDPKWEARRKKREELERQMDALEQRMIDYKIVEEKAQVAMRNAGQSVKKSIPFNSHSIDIGSEEAVLAHLEGGAVVGSQAAALRHDGRHGLLGMRNERMEKGGIAGGTIYQGEHNEQGSREGDQREAFARAQELDRIVTIDGAGHNGAGGLDEWWADADEKSPEVRTRPDIQGMTKGMALIPVNIIDDSDPETRAHRSDVHRRGFAVQMAYQGGGRETRRLGQ